MDKIPLRILGQAKSDSTPEHFIIILEDSRESRRLPIVIGPYEAQAIAIGLEGISVGRPMTHDLLKNTIAAFQGAIKEVVIDRIEEGVFHARLQCEDASRKQFSIDARSSDAIAMAVRFDCPIYTYEPVLSEAALPAEDTEIIYEGDAPEQKSAPAQPDPDKPLHEYPRKELETFLERALEREDYESAAKLRDAINNKLNN
ncbi:bifunctional nuclease domain-containing protein [Phaeodactylibacter xiamenensis]|uniref:bifunctional nuclease family protein n=1 Tax=Phaeodactylibacter xiamenensis TaxID=1524460 RepID=UPI003BAB8E17